MAPNQSRYPLREAVVLKRIPGVVLNFVGSGTGWWVLWCCLTSELYPTPVGYWQFPCIYLGAI